MNASACAFLSVLLRIYTHTHAQAHTYSANVLTIPWYVLLPQYKVHSTCSATCKRHEIIHWRYYLFHHWTLCYNLSADCSVPVSSCSDSVKVRPCVCVSVCVYMTIHFSKAKYLSVTCLWAASEQYTAATTIARRSSCKMTGGTYTHLMLMMS